MVTSRTHRFRRTTLSRRRSWFNFRKNETAISGRTRYGPSDNTPGETSPTREDLERYERDDLEEADK